MFTEHVIMKHKDCDVVPFARRLEIVSHSQYSMDIAYAHNVYKSCMYMRFILYILYLALEKESKFPNISDS